MRRKTDEQEFNESVDRLLQSGMHTLRGISEQEYRKRCRTAWDSKRKARPGEWKGLTDHLMPGKQVLCASQLYYADPEVDAGMLESPSPADHIECRIFSILDEYGRKWGQRKTESGVCRPSPDAAQPYAVALFDVLGFANLVEGGPLDSIYAKYEALLSEEVEIENAQASMLLDGGFSGIAIHKPEYAYFSDTIVIWEPLERHVARPFVYHCGRLLASALRIGLPLRGAIALGDAILDKERMVGGRLPITMGGPLNEAHRLEQAQEWIGAAFCPSAMWPDWVAEMHPRDVMLYRAPLKPDADRDALCGALVVDWTRHFHDADALDHVRRLAASLRVDAQEQPAVAAKYHNTMEFIEAAKQWQDEVQTRRLRGFVSGSQPASTENADKITIAGQDCGTIVYRKADDAVGMLMGNASAEALRVLWAATLYGLGEQVPLAVLQWCCMCGLIKAPDASQVKDAKPYVDELCRLGLMVPVDPGQEATTSLEDSYRCHVKAEIILSSTPPPDTPEPDDVKEAFAAFHARQSEAWRESKDRQSQISADWHAACASRFILDTGSADVIDCVFRMLRRMRRRKTIRRFCERIEKALPRAKTERDRWRLRSAQALCMERLGSFESAVALYDDALAQATESMSPETTIIARMRATCLRRAEKRRK